MGVCNCKLTTHNVHAGIQHSYEFQPLCQKQNLSCMKTSKTECPETASFLQRAPSLCVKQNLLYEKKKSAIWVGVCNGKLTTHNCLVSKQYP